MYSIILCGGSGTRLWPLSRKNFPKQFLKLYSDKSLLQETFLRMKEIVPQKNIYFVTNEENYFNVLNQIKELYTGFSESQILKEPKSLNTMPAIALAVKYLQDKVEIKKEAPIIMVPSDHYIGDKTTYVRIAKNALLELGNNLGTIGVIPQSAHTGLGYIKKGEKKGNYHKIDSFKEKPINLPNVLKPTKILNNNILPNLSNLNYYNNIPISAEIKSNNYTTNIPYDIIYRFSGFYEPIFYDLQLFEKNFFNTSVGNYKFDTSLTEFGIIKERKIRKINHKGSILKLDNIKDQQSIYPMIQEFGYLVTDSFIFKSVCDPTISIYTSPS
jgi:UTP-glucose-1-phosphate uridylyltransferase